MRDWAGKFLTRFVREERGSALVLAAAGLAGALAFAAVAVDAGLVYTARAEAHRAADMGAHAGAGMLIFVPDDEGPARATAIQFAGRNDVRGVPVTVPEGDVDVNLDDLTVTVTVRRTAGSIDGPVQTIFARYLGIDQVDVTAVATAEASPAGAVTCPLPVALPNRWEDVNGNGLYDPGIDFFDPEQTGYNENDIGLRVEIKTQSGSGSGATGEQDDDEPVTASPCVNHPSWRCWFEPDGEVGGGTSDLGRAILGEDCDNSRLFQDGEILVGSGAGNKQRLVLDEFRQLIDSEPDLRWDEGCNCVKRGDEVVTSANRLRSMVLVNPDAVTGTGADTRAPIAGLTGVFVEKVATCHTCPHAAGPPGRWNVYVRLSGFGGTGPAGPTSGPIVKRIRIIE